LASAVETPDEPIAVARPDDMADIDAAELVSISQPPQMVMPDFEPDAFC